MKHDLYSIVIDGLKELYGFKRENTNYLYRYLYIRASIHYNKKKINDKELFRFIVDELNLSIFNDKDSITSEYLSYKGEKHYTFNSNRDFHDNFVFRADLEGDINIKQELEEVFKKGYQRAYKFRGLPNYNDYRKYGRLLELNERFGADPISSEGLEGFETNSVHNPFKRSLEESLEVELKSSRHKKTETTTFISEEDLEDYLIDNLELIEPGLQFIKRQVSVPGGFIDILAKDVNDSICIIELKINEDKNLVWQVLHYPQEIKKMYRGKNVRMITVSPTYSKSIHDVLIRMGTVEALTYKIKVESGKIAELTINK